MTLDFGHGPERLKNWARYVVENPQGVDANRVARALFTTAENLEADERRKAAESRQASLRYGE
jgi:hypothetical protein